ncbi:MAG: hypothetical protein ACTSQH_06940 [Candidatus Hodarchaeales archaeon]
MRATTITKDGKRYVKVKSSLEGKEILIEIGKNERISMSDLKIYAFITKAVEELTHDNFKKLDKEVKDKTKLNKDLSDEILADLALIKTHLGI